MCDFDNWASEIANMRTLNDEQGASRPPRLRPIKMASKLILERSWFDSSLDLKMDVDLRVIFPVKSTSILCRKEAKIDVEMTMILPVDMV